MIELFDPARLLPRKDRSLLAAGVLLSLGAGALGVYGLTLQHQWQRAEAQRRTLAAELQRTALPPPPASSTVLADLLRQAETLEAELAASSGDAGNGLSASQWLDRLDALGTADVSVSLAEIDRAGAARIDGMARTPQALGRYVQAWEQQDRLAAVPARGIEIRQDAQAAPQLRFQLRATALRGNKATTP